MEGSDVSRESLRRLNVSERQSQVRQANARGIVVRLWETYAADLSATLEAYNSGEISEKLLHCEAPRLVRAMEDLRGGGAIAKALERAQIVILDRIIDEVGT